MLGLLGRAPVGFSGLDSELQRGEKGEPRQKVHAFPCAWGKTVFF